MEFFAELFFIVACLLRASNARTSFQIQHFDNFKEESKLDQIRIVAKSNTSAGTAHSFALETMNDLMMNVFISVILRLLAYWH